MEKQEDEMFDLKLPIIIPEIKLISFENYSKNTPLLHDQHMDRDKANDYCLTSSSEEIINFSSSSNSSYKDDSQLLEKTAPTTTIRSPSQAQDHVMAERKRRHNLSQLFISLSKLVPGLKKLDKASVLEDGINYLKSLEERVRVLEEEEIRMKKNSIDTTSISKDIDEGGPEIQARISDKHVLIKVLCNKDMEFMMSRIAGEMDKIHLNLMDIRIMPFGLASFHITILAQMQSEFKGTLKDIVDHLHTVLLNPSS